MNPETTDANKGAGQNVPLNKLAVIPWASISERGEAETKKKGEQMGAEGEEEKRKSEEAGGELLRWFLNNKLK